MDEQPHYLGISFPGRQVQGVTAFGISHIGQRIIPQKDLDHVPRKRKPIMSLQNSGVLPANSSFRTRTAQSLSRLPSPSAPLCRPELLAQPLPFIPQATRAAAAVRPSRPVSHDTDSSPLLI